MQITRPSLCQNTCSWIFQKRYYAILPDFGRRCTLLRLSKPLGPQAFPQSAIVVTLATSKDEKLVLFRCSHPQVCALRQKYAMLYENKFSSLRRHASFRMPCIGTSHHVSSQDFLIFLSQDNNKFPFFLHDLMCSYEQAIASSQTSLQITNFNGWAGASVFLSLPDFNIIDNLF